MTKVLPVGLILVVFILSFIKSTAQRKVTLEKANCMVSVPGEMDPYTDTIQTEIGDIIYRTYVYNDSLLQLHLSYCEYPEGTIHSDSTELLQEFFATTISASIEKVKGHQRYASEIIQFGYPGWFWRTDYGNNKYCKTKVFVAGRKFYKLQFFGLMMADQEKTSDLFFDSFQFIDLRKNRN